MIPAVRDSYVCSNWPSNRLTSVDVPPMSKPITGVPLYSSKQHLAYPTTPPAGPDNIARDPQNLSIYKNYIQQYQQHCTKNKQIYA